MYKKCHLLFYIKVTVLTRYNFMRLPCYFLCIKQPFISYRIHIITKNIINWLAKYSCMVINILLLHDRTVTIIKIRLQLYTFLSNCNLILCNYIIIQTRPPLLSFTTFWIVSCNFIWLSSVNFPTLF